MHLCFTYELSNFCKHFIRFISLSSVHLIHACEVTIFVFKLINMEFTRAKDQIFIEVGKNVDFMKTCNVHPGLKFHPGLAKPS